ncbi:MAG: hypothetical protein FRX49_06383 [Trebouxia sp. A1-2]|nr:MAG: hypothetical protein FRX49_06383 [Trebouxia sp. A1-2]
MVNASAGLPSGQQVDDRSDGDQHYIAEAKANVTPKVTPSLLTTSSGAGGTACICLLAGILASACASASRERRDTGSDLCEAPVMELREAEERTRSLDLLLRKLPPQDLSPVASSGSLPLAGKAGDEADLVIAALTYHPARLYIDDLVCLGQQSKEAKIVQNTTNGNIQDKDPTENTAKYTLIMWMATCKAATCRVLPRRAPMREDLPEPTLPTTHTNSPGPTLTFTSLSHQVASGAPSGLLLLPFFTCPDDASLAAVTVSCCLGKASANSRAFSELQPSKNTQQAAFLALPWGAFDAVQLFGLGRFAPVELTALNVKTHPVQWLHRVSTLLHDQILTQTPQRHHGISHL